MSPKRATAPVKRRGIHATAGTSPRSFRIAILTVSDTRRGADDLSGGRAQARVEAAGHQCARRDWVRDDAAAIRRAVRGMLARPDIDAVVVTGGTGIAARDVTPEALAPVIERDLPGFGERFRALSVEQIGEAAWLSRATAGVARNRLVFLLPGSPHAVDLALDRLILPELAHAMRLLGRAPSGD